MSQNKNYNTKSRKFILEFLEKNSSTTVSAYDILNHLNSNGISVNLTTVYRFLNKLTNEKTVIKLSGENGQKNVYQLVSHKKTCHQHIHTQCIKCGKLIHLDCGFMNELKNHLSRDHGFTLKCDGSVLYGICNQCAND